MASSRHSSVQPLKRLELAAVGLAILLSVACLAKGAVSDATVAILMLVSLPVLWLALGDARAVHVTLKRLGLVVLVGYVVLILLQCVTPSGQGESSVWQHMAQLTNQEVPDRLLQDRAAWMQDIGRFIFIIIVAAIALLIGSSESSVRIFLQALLISGAIGLAITFFTATRTGVSSSTINFYTHGFVNPNNAAAYIGMMLLVALAQAARFFRMPGRNFYKTILNFIDGLSMRSITNGVFLAFCLLLTLAGLFLTGSRGGIVLGILCGTVFCNLVLLKANVDSRMRKWLIMGAMVVMAPIVIWSFMNFGQVIIYKLATNGVSSNSRMDVQQATLPMIADHWQLGTGLGSFQSVFQQYRPEAVTSDGIIEKAHNTYLQFAAEMGVPALVGLLVVLGWFGVRLYGGFRTRKERYVIPAFGLSVWLLGVLFSLFDFPLEIPGLTALYVAILVVSVSQTDPRFSEPIGSSSGAGQGDAVKRVRIRRRRSVGKPIT